MKTYTIAVPHNRITQSIRDALGLDVAHTHGQWIIAAHSINAAVHLMRARGFPDWPITGDGLIKDSSEAPGILADAGLLDQAAVFARTPFWMGSSTVAVVDKGGDARRIGVINGGRFTPDGDNLTNPDRAEATDVTLPITPARIGSGVDAIVEKALPSPLGELCMPVGLMKRELTAYAGELVQAAYNDHAAVVDRDLADNILGSVENGPWKLITDPNLRQMVGGYVADTCHTVAQAAGLPDVAEQAGNAVPPEGLPTGGRLVASDARDRLARHLYLAERTDEWAAREWDFPQHVNQEPYLRRADAILAVITGKDN
ncbi:hypothetical protein AB0L22_09200 [Micromonospora haikouensis]|uniref:hypothetical protein n=1 Tax=Micromonospora haikouensis TaxID=686309 RepID=UPI0034304DF9